MNLKPHNTAANDRLDNLITKLIAKELRGETDANEHEFLRMWRDGHIIKDVDTLRVVKEVIE